VLEDFEGGRQNNWLPPDPNAYWFWDLSELSPPHRGQDALAVTYYRPDPDQFIAFEVTVDSDFTAFGQIQMWVFGAVTLQLELEDLNSNTLELDPATAVNPQGWTLLEFNYAGADGINLGAIQVVKIFVVPDDTTIMGRIVLDEIYLSP
jgi:hypothetical protein